ncbi:MAG: TRAP transporter small permease subunit [Gammaproteobacteria bacterium]|nr:MAG: TRAP transporter small permease subunit [Gammaproteobacteria bacterium]
MPVTSLHALEKIALLVDRLVRWLGRLVAWLTLTMVLITATVVVLRYVFGIGWIWLQETVTWMHATVFLLAAAYTFSHDEHVRVDIFYRGMSPRRRALVDSLGVLLLLLPTCAWIIYSGWDYVAASWQVRESSLETGGMPGLFLLKSLIIVTPLLLAIEGLAIVTLRWARVFRAEPSPTARS